MRRTKALWAAVLLAGALVALTPLGVAAARADEGQPASGMDLETPIEVDGSQAVANPFPDKISDEEIASMTKSNVLVSKEAIRKVEIELTSGEKILFPNNFAGEPAEAPSSVLPTDIVQRYNGNIRRITTYYVIPPGIDDYCIICVGDWITSGYRDGKVSLETYDRRAVKPSRVLRNGQEVDSNPLYFKFVPRATQCFEATTEIPQDIKLCNLYAWPNLHGVRKSYSGNAATQPKVEVRIWTNISYVFPKATFHYVDEAAYRTLTDQPRGPIAERSAGDTAFSNRPAEKLGLTDLLDTVTTSDFYDDKLARPNNIDAEPMLNLPDGKAKSRFFDPAVAAATGRIAPGDYVLCEDVVPQGYARAEDLAFTVEPLAFETEGEGDAVTHTLGERPLLTVSERPADPEGPDEPTTPEEPPVPHKPEQPTTPGEKNPASQRLAKDGGRSTVREAIPRTGDESVSGAALAAGVALVVTSVDKRQRSDRA